MSDIFSVSNAQELRQALHRANGGETIELAGGDYGDLDLLTFKTWGVKAIYDSPVTITSADPEDRASFSGMDLREVKNLTFDNVVFDSDYAWSAVWVAPFKYPEQRGHNDPQLALRGRAGLGDRRSDSGRVRDGQGAQSAAAARTS